MSDVDYYLCEICNGLVMTNEPSYYIEFVSSREYIRQLNLKPFKFHKECLNCLAGDIEEVDTLAEFRPDITDGKLFRHCDLCSQCLYDDNMRHEYIVFSSSDVLTPRSRKGNCFHINCFAKISSIAFVNDLSVKASVARGWA